MSPTVSVLLPVYNERPDFLHQAVTSILSQTFADFELILMDDGSTRKDTLAMIQQLQDGDARIRVHRGPNCGLTRTLRAGLTLCEGQYVARQDSDDWSEPTRLDKQVRFLEENPSVAVVGSNITLHQENGTPLWMSRLPQTPAQVLASFPSMNPFAHGSTCFRKGDAEAVGGYREACAHAEDYDFFWRLCERAGGANLPEALYHYRRTATAISSTKGQEQTIAVAIARHLGRMRSQAPPEDAALAVSLARAEIARSGSETRTLLKNGDHSLLAGHYVGALNAYLHAVAAAPSRPSGYLKLCRFVMFLAFPPVRRILFSGFRL